MFGGKKGNHGGWCDNLGAMITDIDGVQVGHWTNQEAATGCTVVLFPEDTTASGEVRGGAPAEREMVLLEPTRLVTQIDAVVLTGGSAFGLASADGVMRYCEEQDRGVATAAGRVPIVVGLGLFDLDVGDATVRPASEHGYQACQSAVTGVLDVGRVGAGTGAWVNRGAVLSGEGEPRPGGVVTISARSGDLVVSALVVVNAFGDPGGDPKSAEGLVAALNTARPPVIGNTTIGVVATNARLTKEETNMVAQMAHDGLARVVRPAHTMVDGDTLFALAAGKKRADVSLIGAYGAELMVAAVVRAVRAAAEPPRG